MKSMISNSDDHGEARPDTGNPEGNTASSSAPSSLHRFLDDALAKAAALIEDQASTGDRLRSIYYRAFPLGEGLGDLLARRACLGQRRLGLAALIEGILQVPQEPPSDPAEAARRALLAGLCWRLEADLLLGGALQPDLARLSDGELYARAVAASQSMGRRAATPTPEDDDVA